MTEHTENKGRFSILLPAVVVAVAAVAVYANAIFSDFVYDDIFQVVENPWIKDFSHIPKMFTSSVWSFKSERMISNYYRPFMHLFYMLAYSVFGLRSWGFHLVNIIIHSANSVMVFLLVARLFRDAGTGPHGRGTSAPSLKTMPTSPPFVAGVLFAVHPIHTEAVAWVACLPELTYTFFSLLSLYFYIRAREGGGRKSRYAVSLAAFAVAALCKEPALMVPGLMLSYDFIIRKERPHILKWGKRYLPYAMIAGIYLLLRYQALGGLAPEKKYVFLTTYQYLINAFPLFTQYLRSLLFPVNLAAFHVLHPLFSLAELKGAVSLAAVAGFLGVTLYCVRRHPLISYANVLIIAPLLPVLYIPAVGENTFTERYLYLPSVGFVLLGALVFSMITAKIPRSRTVTVLVFLSLVGIYSLQGMVRNTVWKDELVFFTDTVKKAPDVAHVRNNFGIALAVRGRLDEAMEQYKAAISLNPLNAKAYSNLGEVYFKKGWTDKAIQEFRAAIDVEPDYYNAHTNLGVAYLSKGALDKAIPEFEKAARVMPSSVTARSNLAKAYERKGLRDKAIEEYRVSAALDKNSADLQYSLGRLYDAAGRQDEAIACFRAAARLRPDNAVYHNVLGIAYGRKGESSEAILEFEAAVRLAPGEPAYRRNLEKARTLGENRERGGSGGKEEERP